MFSSASDETKLFPKNFSKKSNLDDSYNLDISVTSKMVKKVITNLDSSNASGPNCISVVVLKNFDLEHSYLLAELFDMCLKELYF